MARPGGHEGRKETEMTDTKTRFYYLAITVYPDKSIHASQLYKTMREAAGHAEGLNRSEPKADHYAIAVELEEN